MQFTLPEVFAVFCTPVKLVVKPFGNRPQRHAAAVTNLIYHFKWEATVWADFILYIYKALCI